MLNRKKKELKDSSFPLSLIISLTTKLCERSLVCSIRYIIMEKRRMGRKSEKIKTPKEGKKKKV